MRVSDMVLFNSFGMARNSKSIYELKVATFLLSFDFCFFINDSEKLFLSGLSKYTLVFEEFSSTLTS